MYVFSTLSNDNAYPLYKDGVKVKTVLINGKANLINRNFITPKGVVTNVSNEDYALLKEDENFKKQVVGGYFTVEAKEVEVEKVAKDMTPKDKSAPVTKKDIEKENAKLDDADKIEVKVNRV